MAIFSKTTVVSFAALASLTACTFPPHVEDWDRERITEIPDIPLQVEICFDLASHSKEMVYELARKECSQRITEVQNMVQSQITRQSQYQAEAEGVRFQGPVQRQKNIDAMIATLQLRYIENDKWECPLVTPNRVTLECVYDVNAKDSGATRAIAPDNTTSPELPPELPEDLKPQ